MTKRILSVIPHQIDIEIDGVEYVLKELDGESSISWKTERMAKYIKDDKGNIVDVKSSSDLDSLLVSYCLFNKSTGQKVPLETIRKWPERVIETLSNDIVEISGLNKKDLSLCQLLKKALDNPNSPVTFKSLGTWIKSLDANEFGPLSNFLELDTDIKN